MKHQKEKKLKSQKKKKVKKDKDDIKNKKQRKYVKEIKTFKINIPIKSEKQQQSLLILFLRILYELNQLKWLRLNKMKEDIESKSFYSKISLNMLRVYEPI